jgi:hypothetical protein
MINPELLRKSGWSEDLIKAAVQVAEQVKSPAEIVGDTELVIISSTREMEDSSTTDLSEESNVISTWPRF